jgi:hypothetical protein
MCIILRPLSLKIWSEIFYQIVNLEPSSPLLDINDLRTS